MADASRTDAAQLTSSLRGRTRALSDAESTAKLPHSPIGPYTRCPDDALKRDLAAVAGPVFLSYAREDAEPASVLYFNLRSAGFQPWMDVHDLHPGQQWQDAIADAIRNASFFLACLSEHSVSKRGMVQKELRIALDVWETYLDSDVYVIPIRFTDCQVPPQIARFQWVDYFAANGWEQLENGLRQGLRHRATKGHRL